MKTPNRNEIQIAFARLQSSPESVSILDVIEWSHRCRWEPRLAEILVQHIFKNWKTWNPLTVHETLKLQAMPQSFLVLSEHLYFLLTGPQRKTFKLWLNCVSSGFEPVPYQAFYLINKFAGSRLRSESEYNLKPFARWGFYCSYLMLNKENKLPRTSITKTSRGLVLLDLIQEMKVFRVQDYIDRLNNKIHPRQAERDLKACPQIKAHGQTRNRTYRFEIG